MSTLAKARRFVDIPSRVYQVTTQGKLLTYRYHSTLEAKEEKVIVTFLCHSNEEEVDFCFEFSNEPRLTKDFTNYPTKGALFMDKKAAANHAIAILQTRINRATMTIEKLRKIF